MAKETKDLTPVNLDLNGKKALVTGSTAGIGFAIAKALAAEGARVIINGRTDARVNEAITSIRAETPSAKLEALAIDLSKAQAAAEAGERVHEIAILVNNLGVYAPKSFEEISDEDWTSIIETNFMSGVRLSRYYLPRMRAANWGRIIFISSESAVNIPVEMTHYGVTKTMQVALARGLAETTAGTGVAVNSLLPWPTRSEGVMAFVANRAKFQRVPEREVEKGFFQALGPSALLERLAPTDETVGTVAPALGTASAGHGLHRIFHQIQARPFHSCALHVHLQVVGHAHF